MMNLLTTLPTDRPATQEELDREAQEWGFATWDEFYDAVDDELERRGMMDYFSLFSTGVVNVPAR
jgi:hypothetical protein